MYPSILKIKSVVKPIRLFNFNFVSSDDASKIINLLDSTKNTSGVIPTKIVKLPNKEICQDLANCINASIKKKEFPNKLKATDITPIFKKEDPLNKENYRPVMCSRQCLKYLKEYYLTKLTKFSNNFHSPLLCGFRKGYITQYALVNLLQKWKKES